MTKVHDNYWTRNPYSARVIALFAGMTAAVVVLVLANDRFYDSEHEVPRGLAATPFWVVVGAVLISVPLAVLVVNASVSLARKHNPRFTTLTPEELQRRHDAGALLRGERIGSLAPEPPEPRRRGVQRHTMILVAVGATALSVLVVISFTGPSGPAYYCPLEGRPDRWCDAWIGKVTRDVTELRETEAYDAEVIPYAGQGTEAPSRPVRVESFVGNGMCVYIGRGGNRYEEASERPWVELGQASCLADAELIDVPK